MKSIRPISQGSFKASKEDRQEIEKRRLLNDRMRKGKSLNGPDFIDELKKRLEETQY